MHYSSDPPDLRASNKPVTSEWLNGQDEDSRPGRTEGKAAVGQ